MIIPDPDPGKTFRIRPDPDPDPQPCQKNVKKGKMAESGIFKKFFWPLRPQFSIFCKVNNISLDGIWDLPFMFFGVETEHPSGQLSLTSLCPYLIFLIDFFKYHKMHTLTVKDWEQLFFKLSIVDSQIFFWFLPQYNGVKKLLYYSLAMPFLIFLKLYV